jgi:predicted nucleic acid-binding protein
MPYVLDCSVTLAWLLPDENDPGVDGLADALALESAVAPCVWPLEVANVLMVACRRGRISEEECRSLLSHASSLPVEVEPGEPEHIFGEVARLAAAHHLTCYDALYLDLAIRRSLPLATLDARLRNACAAANIRVLPPERE